MGGVISKNMNRAEVQKIINKVFDQFADTNQNNTLDQSELYIGVLLVYNMINKKFPGPHNDPPKAAEVNEMLRKFDFNQNGVLDRAEFAAFCDEFLKDTSVRVGRNMLLVLVAAPALAFLTKGTIGELPAIGEAVRAVPDSLFVPVVSALIAAGAKLRLGAA